MDSSLEYTVGDYRAALHRRRGVLVAVALPIIVGALLLAEFLPDEYTSSAQIDINLEGSNVKTLEPIEVTSYADQYIAKLTDRALARDNMLVLAAEPAIISSIQDGLTESERVAEIRNSIQVSVLTQLVLSPSSGREVDLISGFRVASVGANPEFVFQIASYVARLFLDADRLSRTERAISTSLFLSEQMNQIETKIVAIEKDVVAFKVANACCLPETE